MKKAASIISWTIGILEIILGFITLALGYSETKLYYYNGYWRQTSQTVAFPIWAWIVFIVFVIVRLLILFWREASVENGHKIACGIVTMIFISVLGGIFTLCVPIEEDDDANKKRPYWYNDPSAPQDMLENPFSNSKRSKELQLARTFFDKGIITQEEYDNRVKEINTRFDSFVNEYGADADPSPSFKTADSTTADADVSESERQEDIDNSANDSEDSPDDNSSLLKQYKQLLDDGFITQEAYDAKVASLK